MLAGQTVLVRICQATLIAVTDPDSDRELDAVTVQKRQLSIAKDFNSHAC